MERIEKRMEKLEKEVESLWDFVMSFEQKSETYWGILKSLISSAKQELSKKVS